MSTGDAKQLSNATLGHRSAEASDLLNLIGGQFDVLSTPEVDRLRDWLHVSGVDARSISAQMVKLEAAGDGANEALIHRTVGLDGLSATGECLAVACPVDGPLPNPTPVVGNDVLQRGLPTVVPGQEVRRLSGLDSTQPVRPIGDGRSLAATAPAESIFNAFGTDGDDILRVRHSDLLSGRGVAVARGVSAPPGFLLCAYFTALSGFAEAHTWA